VFLLSLAILIRHSVVRILLWIASAHFMFNLIFSEGFGLIAHSFGGSPRSLVGALVLHVFYIVFFALWSFPFLLGFVAVRFDAGVDYFWLSRFRRKSSLLISGTAFAMCAGVLAFQPTFSNLWKQKISVEQTVQYSSGTVSTKITSNDYLSGTQIRYINPDGTTFDTLLTRWTSEARLREAELTGQPWLSTERTIEQSTLSDSTVRMNINLTVRARFKPYTLSVAYSSATDRIEQPNSPLAFTSTEHTITVSWYSFPDTVLTIPLSFTVPTHASLTETIEATFVEPIIPLTIVNENASVSWRSKVSLVTPMAIASIQK
ncbi:MAG: hypothetical protein MN733_09420, partial [Nitrososphaera sp.]|nr:hypothetical protein [Nitrososphaera sp.]